ncbi:multidrug effflux MFS transporter [Pseudomonas sp. GCM10022188]|uniref:multidrug effflux MFS transporter n=1 Tax=Pseudomonas TaxID=286 RepID=UPI001E4C6375|nr:multidrug effflux MFS transporter [Pseudomonas oryzagri]MCC6073745.1 multidrug effflux MFS transporter [Pseudomonas oryzagri]
MSLPILLILGALTAFAPLAIDFYLPAFPALARFFATDVEHVQLSLAAYFVGLAAGQLLYGPLADRFGRRRPLQFGIALFALASLACSLAPSLEWLVVARFVQALGGCAGMVVSRAVVRDLCDPVASARVFSRLVLVMGLAPILAPFAGGLLLAHVGWQAIFVSLGLFAALCLLLVCRYLPETRPQDAPPAPLAGALLQYRLLLADRVFLGHALTGGLSIAAMFAYIAGSPFVFIDLYGVPAQQYGWLFGSNAAGFILVAQFNSRLLRRRGPDFWVPRAVAFYLCAALALFVVAALQPAVLWPLLPPLFACIATLGLVMPNTSACAMAGQGTHAGSASALLGSLQFGIAALAAALVGALHDGTARPMALVMLVCAAGATLVAWRTARCRADAAVSLGREAQ